MKIVGLLLLRYNNHPWVQRILYHSWLGKQGEQVISGDGRIEDVDEDVDEETFVYDGDARVRGGHGNERGKYLDAPVRESDRLLGNGGGSRTDTGEVRRSEVYDDDGGFGTIQPSLLR